MERARTDLASGTCRVTLAWLLSLLLVASVVVTGQAGAQAQESTQCAGDHLTAFDERSASVLAGQCGVPVEVQGAQTHTQRQFAEPDGSFTLRSHARPRWARDDAGQWVGVDPSLRVDAHGQISTVATAIDVEVSAGGSDPLVSASDRVGRSLQLVWPDELPVPELDGATATYPEVYDGVDLQVTAGADWFSYALVVHSRQAAQGADLSRVEVGITGEGLDLTQTPDGVVVAADDGGQPIFSAARAQMWDSSSVEPASEVASLPGGDIPGAEPGRVADVEMMLSDNTLSVLPDLELMADETTEFPVTIDPTFSTNRLAWATVGDHEYADDTWWADSQWPRVDGFRMGFAGWTDPGTEGYGTWRTMTRFDTEVLSGSTINSAQAGLTVYHTGGCHGPFPLELWHTDPVEQGAVPTSWNSTSDGWQQQLDTTDVPSANSTGDWCDPRPDRDVSWDGTGLRDAVQDAATSEGEPSITLGLRAGDESDRMQWMRAYEDSFVLEVNYTPVTGVPSGLATDGVGCLAPEGSRVAGAQPTLSGTPWHSEGQVQAHIEVRTLEGSDNLHTWTSDGVDTGVEVSWQLDAALADGDYRWRMRSEDPSSSAASAWSGWCEFSVDGLLDQQPPVSEEKMECPVADGEPLESAHESVAVLLAQACDEPVEVTSERDYGVRVLAQPEGTLVAQQHTAPQWAHDGDGDWVEADTSFVQDGDAITTAATVSEISVSDGGSGPLVTATDPDGGSVSLHWPDPLPSPSIDGDTVTYPEVFTDVDLQVTASADGFSYVLVIKSAQAATDPNLAEVTVGVSADGGLSVQQDGDGVQAVDANGEVVFSAPAAFMWDSSEPEEPADPQELAEGDGSGDDFPMPGRFADMPLELDGSSLTVQPDQDMLTDPEAEFPIRIDPPFSGARMHWATVHQGTGWGWTDDNAWPRDGLGGPEMRVGSLGWWSGFACGDACGLWRSAIRFDIGSLSGRDIVSAKVKATQTHTSGCGSYGLQLWYVTAFTSGVSWSGLSDNWQDWLQTRPLSSSNRTGGCSGTSPTGVTFDNSAVRNRVQSHADAGHGSLSFGFRSSNETSKDAYRRIAVDSVVLEVEYNQAAKTPTGLDTNGGGCSSSAPGPWLTDPRPTLSGTPRDPDGSVGAHLQIRRADSSSTHYSWWSGRNRASGKQVNHRIPSGDRLESGEYRWRMRSLDSDRDAGASSWNQWCYFRVDVSAPTTPAVELVGDPPEAGEQVTLRLSSSDAHSGLQKISYGINEEVPRHEKTTSGTTEITFTASESGGRNWVYVWAHDHAGNVANRAVYDFFAARFVEATPAGAWRLDGDGVDDSGHGHELMLGSGVEWSADAGPSGDGSLEFDHTGCVATEGPVVRTDAEYTVAAWVRLDDDTGDHNFVTQAGDRRSGFYLKHRDGNWRFSLASHDASSTSWAALESNAGVVPGQWTHLAVRVDPPAGHMQMYVDGELDNERDIPWPTWNAEGPLHVGCAARSAGYTWDPHDGALHHVGVWQGLLTSEEIEDAYHGALPAGLTGDWRLRSNGSDESAHARGLNVPPSANWSDDQFGRRTSAVQLDGTNWAQSNGPIVRTDQSFTVSAWVKLAEKDDEHRSAVLAHTGQVKSGFYLRYDYGFDRWHFTMPSNDASDVDTWYTVRSNASPEVGRWYHLVAVSDHAAGELRLYVDGELHDESSGPSQPWHVDGELLIGASGHTSGGRWDEMIGAISDVKTWRGALTDEEAAEVYGGNPAVQRLGQWRLNGDGSDELGSHDLALAGTESVDYEWTTSRWCFPMQALGLLDTGAGHAATTDPVIVSDESFTVAAWVRPDVAGVEQTVLSQGGHEQPGWVLQATAQGSWRFAMAEQDTAGAGWASAESPAGSAQPGTWTHVVGVYDLAQQEIRLYVDGELTATEKAGNSPWQAHGPFYAGATGLADGTVSRQLHGAVDDINAWSSTLHHDEIGRLARQAPGFPCL